MHGAISAALFQGRCAGSILPSSKILRTVCLQSFGTSEELAVEVVAEDAEVEEDITLDGVLAGCDGLRAMKEVASKSCRS
jgi:hypothetical protein